MKILLATDGSECADRAAQFLTRFPFSGRDEITVLHVISDIPYEDDAYASIRHFYKGVSPRILQSSAKILKSLGAKVTLREEEGTPDSMIMAVADTENVDLIVMGTRGLQGVQSLFLGSVTRSVVINSARPVLVTRQTPWETSPPMKVLLASDGSPSSAATARLLSSLPFPPETECLIVQVTGSAFSRIPDQFFREAEKKIREDIAQVRSIENRQALEIVEQSKDMVANTFSRVEQSIVTGDPATEILNEAERFCADIVAAGSRGLKGIRGAMGSVSRRILSHAQCPVLIGKEAKQQEQDVASLEVHAGSEETH